MKRLIFCFFTMAMLLSACGGGHEDTPEYGSAEYYYQEAEKAAARGDTEWAISNYKSAGNYKDAKNKIEKLYYESGLAYAKEGSDKALDQFAFCLDYSDSRELAEEILMKAVEQDIAEEIAKYELPVLKDLKVNDCRLDVISSGDYIMIAGIALEYESEEFEALSDREKLGYFEVFVEDIEDMDWPNTTIKTHKGVYEYDSRDRTHYLLCDGEEVFSQLVTESIAYTPYNGGSSTCPNCHGSGKVRTYATNEWWDDGYVIDCPLC